MKYILIVREEIVCLFVVLFLTFYYAYYKKMGEEKIDENYYIKLSCAGIIHIIFDIITVFTVNNRQTIPDSINKIAHITFFLSGVFFVETFMTYVIKLTVSYRILRFYKKIQYIPLVCILILSFFLPIEYVDGSATSYSYGPLVFVCYGWVIAYCLICILLVIFRFGELERKTRVTVIPVSVFLISGVVLQAVFPEILMTSASLTFVCIGLFVTLNNPVEAVSQQAFWDVATGLHNKNSYQKLRILLDKKYENRSVQIGFVVCDMNGLKRINDNYGHAEGDKLIKACAAVLLEELKTAYNVYRVGGDEFVAVYYMPNDNLVQAEMEKVWLHCARYKDSFIPLSIAMGYASGICKAGELGALYQKADELMYANKKKMKEENPELVRI